MEGAENITREVSVIEVPAGLININTANQEELEMLSGIGPEKTQKVIEYRTENGYFQTIDEIQKVSGIGPATFEIIRVFITVGA